MRLFKHVLGLKSKDTTGPRVFRQVRACPFLLNRHNWKSYTGAVENIGFLSIRVNEEI